MWISKDVVLVDNDNLCSVFSRLVPQRQMVPVAPRTRLASDEMNNAAIRLVQEHLHALTPQDMLHNSERLLIKGAVYVGG